LLPYTSFHTNTHTSWVYPKCRQFSVLLIIKWTRLPIKEKKRGRQLCHANINIKEINFSIMFLKNWPDYGTLRGKRTHFQVLFNVLYKYRFDYIESVHLQMFLVSLSNWSFYFSCINFYVGEMRDQLGPQYYKNLADKSRNTSLNPETKQVKITWNP